jgi:hypothetical protein
MRARSVKARRVVGLVAFVSVFVAACGVSDAVVLGVDGGDDDSGLDGAPGHDGSGGDSANVDASEDAPNHDGSMPDAMPGDDASDEGGDSARDSASDLDAADGDAASDGGDAADGAGEHDASDASAGDDGAEDGAAGDDGATSGNDAAAGDDGGSDGATDAASSDAADAAPSCPLSAPWIFNEDALALTSGDFTCGFQSGCSSQASCSTIFGATSTDLDAGPGIDWFVSVPGNICDDYPSTLDNQDNFTGNSDDCEVGGVATLTGQIDPTTCTVTGTIYYRSPGGACEYTITYDGRQ